ncbi:hypothetical protein CsSME_00004227 [Camellia sinensis var. sinensis]
MLCVAKRGVKSTEKKKIRITYQFKVTTLKMEWPGSYSGGKQGCCYPKTGKPAKDFTIAGLWPCYLDATIPEFCDSHSHFNIAKTSNLTKNLQTNWPALACPSSDSENKLWSHEWNQHDYFEAALRLKKQVNLLKILTNEGLIQPNGATYDAATGVEEGIRKAVGYMPGNIEATKIIDCPGIPMKAKCAPHIKFRSF